jgi:hypothetical protein
MFSRKTGKVDVILGENSRISGDVSSSGTVVVEGADVGDLDGEKIILGEKSFVQGNIRAVVISVAGRVEGDLSGRKPWRSSQKQGFWEISAPEASPSWKVPCSTAPVTWRVEKRMQVTRKIVRS